MPDVGEGLTEAEILKWYVQPGDTVTDGQVVCEVETAKAAVELPIPFDGVVQRAALPRGHDGGRRHGDHLGRHIAGRIGRQTPQRIPDREAPGLGCG